MNKRIKAPFIPVRKSDTDVSNFDSEFTECNVESYTPSPKDEDDYRKYSGFSFNKSQEDEMEAEEDVDQSNFQLSIQEES